MSNISECPENGFIDTSLFGACSGNGRCVNYTCICNEGWTGRSDFINSEGLDCQIHKTTIRVLWIIAFILINSLYLHTMPKVKARFVQHEELRKKYLLRGKDFRWYHNSTLRAVLSYFIFCGGFFQIYALMKIFNFEDTERIGVTPFATVTFMVTATGYFLGLFFYIPPLMRILLLGSKNFNLLKKVSFGLTLSGLLFEILAGSVTFFILADGGRANELAVGMYVTYFSVNLFCLLGYCLQAGLALKRSEKILSVSFQLHQKPWILSVKRKIGRVQRQIIYECLVQGALYAAFLGWKFLRNKHDYMLPVSWTFATLLWVRIFKAILEKETKVSSGAFLQNDADDIENNFGKSVGKGKRKESPQFISLRSDLGLGKTSLAVVASDAPTPQTEAFSTTADVMSNDGSFVNNSFSKAHH